MAAGIHPTAVVSPTARLGTDVEIGPFCLVGPHVVLGERVRLISHVAIDGHTTIGAGGTIYPFASVGLPPQDLKYKGEPSRLAVGRNVIIREHVTVHTGTAGGGMETVVGEDCLLMVGAHVAHDCRIGNRVILVNNVTLGGHVSIGDHAILGGLSAVHQFVRIGEHAFIGGMSGVEQDVIPYGMVVGERAYLAGLNIVGLKRRGFGREDIHTLRTVYRRLFGGEGELSRRIDEVAAEFGHVAAAQHLLSFIQESSDRKVLKPKLPDAD
jgi:UDP-N-acetylglucosamine acyltransferase